MLQKRHDKRDPGGNTEEKVWMTDEQFPVPTIWFPSERKEQSHSCRLNQLTASLKWFGISCMHIPEILQMRLQAGSSWPRGRSSFPRCVFVQPWSRSLSQLNSFCTYCKLYTKANWLPASQSLPGLTLLLFPTLGSSNIFFACRAHMPSAVGAFCIWIPALWWGPVMDLGVCFLLNGRWLWSKH